MIPVDHGSILAAKRARSGARRSDLADAMRELGSRAYFAARRELVGRPDVRIAVRDGERPDLLTVVAFSPDLLDGPRSTLPGIEFRTVHAAATTVALGNLGEPAIIDHQARALARHFGEPTRRRATGAELNAAGLIRQPDAHPLLDGGRVELTEAEALRAGRSYIAHRYRGTIGGAWGR